MVQTEQIILLLIMLLLPKVYLIKIFLNFNLIFFQKQVLPAFVFTSQINLPKLIPLLMMWLCPIHLGKKLSNYILELEKLLIDVSDLNKGIYIITAKIDGQSGTYRFITLEAIIKLLIT